MRLGNALRDVEAQSEAAAIRTPRLPEAIEQSFALFLRNARSRIGHGHADFVGLDISTYAYTAAARSELQRIADKVVDHLQESLLVGLNDGARRPRAQRERKALLRGARLKGFHGFDEHLSDIA